MRPFQSAGTSSVIAGALLGGIHHVLLIQNLLKRFKTVVYSWQGGAGEGSAFRFAAAFDDNEIYGPMRALARPQVA